MNPDRSSHFRHLVALLCVLFGAHVSPTRLVAASFCGVVPIVENKQGSGFDEKFGFPYVCSGSCTQWFRVVSTGDFHWTHVSLVSQIRDVDQGPCQDYLGVHDSRDYGGVSKYTYRFPDNCGDLAVITNYGASMYVLELKTQENYAVASACQDATHIGSIDSHCSSVNVNGSISGHSQTLTNGIEQSHSDGGSCSSMSWIGTFAGYGWLLENHGYTKLWNNTNTVDVGCYGTRTTIRRAYTYPLEFTDERFEMTEWIEGGDGPKDEYTTEMASKKAMVCASLVAIAQPAFLTNNATSCTLSLTNFGKRADAIAAQWRVKLLGAEKGMKYNVQVTWEENDNGTHSIVIENLEHVGTDDLVQYCPNVNGKPLLPKEGHGCSYIYTKTMMGPPVVTAK